MVFLDNSGHEIYAGPNLDLRAVFEGAVIDEEMGDRVYRTTGHLPSFLFTPAKLRWFQRHRSEAYDRIACVLPLADWLVWRLTGTAASEPTLACEAGLLDIQKREWCSALLNEMGLVSNSIPLLESGTVAGTVNDEAAAGTGLQPGTPVAVAGADTQCGLLGMGVSQIGQVGIVAGWSAPVQMVTAKPVLPPYALTWAGCHLDSATWVLESTCGDVGNSYRWLADTLWGRCDNAFQAMNRSASAVPVGSEGVAVFLGPTRMDVSNLGMRPGGLLFPVPLTFSDTGRGHLARASLEAVAYAIKANLAQLEEIAGAGAMDVTVGGGMTRTPAFVRILVDVLGREIKVSPTPDVSAVGANLCARTALAEYASLGEAAYSVRPRLRGVEPDPLSSAQYEELYERWVRLSEAMQGLEL